MVAKKVKHKKHKKASKAARNKVGRFVLKHMDTLVEIILKKVAQDVLG